MGENTGEARRLLDTTFDKICSPVRSFSSRASARAGIISYVFWEWAFWGVSIPVCIVGYQAATGHWPDFQNQDDLAKLGAEAFAFVNVARFAVPLRIGLALGTTPWVQTNIVDKFQKKE